MTSENPAVRLLEKERETITASIEEMQGRLKEARHALRSIEDAISLLTGAPASPSRSDGPTLKELIVEQLSPDGPGKTPLEISNAITAAGRETGNTTVSSILSRLKNEGAAEKRGDRWFKADAKGSDVGASEPFEDQGPVGRERGYPPSAPEGSIPSGSTASRRLVDDDGWEEPIHRRPLTDEIPF